MKNVICYAMWYTLYMADKVPVQDKLSQILAELMWCLAGTEEDDEYAGQVYMQMEEEENGFFEDEDGDIMWTEVVENGSDDGEEGDEDDEEENKNHRAKLSNASQHQEEE